jgi:hypothetical protein
MNQFSLQVREAISRLAHCHSTCLSMAMTHCLETGGEHSRPQHLRLMLDCAVMCAATADLLSHKSQFHNRICAMCAEVAETCAADCERIGDMEECVHACRQVAASCTEIAKLDHAEILEMASRLPPA